MRRFILSILVIVLFLAILAAFAHAVRVRDAAESCARFNDAGACEYAAAHPLVRAVVYGN